MSNIKVISKGLQTTIQDLGRYGFRSHGIPVSGAMDQSSAKLANILVGNNQNDALLECTLLGPKLEFLRDTIIAITGARVDIYINEQKQKMNSTIYVAANSRLRFGKVQQGCRFYIAFAGGIKIHKFLGSRSTDIVSQIGHPIIKNLDILPLYNNDEKKLFIKLKPLVDNLTQKRIKVYPGPEYFLIKDIELEKIQFTISPKSNRMAYILHSDINVTHTHEMISSGVLPGTIQLTPSGQFTILMRDAQTTGGYPRILQVAEKDLDYIAQRRGGELLEMTKNIHLQ